MPIGPAGSLMPCLLVWFEKCAIIKNKLRYIFFSVCENNEIHMFGNKFLKFIFLKNYENKKIYYDDNFCNKSFISFCKNKF